MFGPTHYERKRKRKRKLLKKYAVNWGLQLMVPFLVMLNFIDQAYFRKLTTLMRRISISQDR